MAKKKKSLAKNPLVIGGLTIVAIGAAATLANAAELASTGDKLKVSLDRIEFERIQGLSARLNIVSTYANPTDRPLNLQLAFLDIFINGNKIGEIRRSLADDLAGAETEEAKRAILNAYTIRANRTSKISMPFKASLIAIGSQVLTALKEKPESVRAEIKGDIKVDGFRTSYNESIQIDLPKLKGLGSNLKPSYEILQDYSPLIVRGENTSPETINHGSGGLQKTIKYIKANSLKYRFQVEKLSHHLYDKNPVQAFYNVWHFIKTNYKYQLDDARFEDLRTPYNVHKTGVYDCDDATMYADMLLKNMGYDSQMNIVELSNDGAFSHIFAEGVKDGKRYAIDPCPPLTRFNQRSPHITKEMIVRTLNGLQGMPVVDKLAQAQKTLAKSVNNKNKANTLREIRIVRWLQLFQGEDLAAALRLRPLIYDISSQGYLIFRDGIDSETAGMYAAIQVARSEQSGLGSLERWRELDADVANIDNPSLNGGLGFLKKIRNKIKKGFNFVKDTAGKAVKTLVKNPIHAINRFNPITVTIRNAALLAFRLNVFNISKKLEWAYRSEADATKKGLNMAEWRKLVKASKTVEKVFNKLGGKEENLRKAIKKGADKGGKSLGEPASTAAASGFIATILKILKAVDFKDLFESFGRPPVKDDSQELIKKVDDAKVDPNDINDFPFGQFESDELLTPTEAEAVQEATGERDGNNEKKEDDPERKKESNTVMYAVAAFAALVVVSQAV